MKSKLLIISIILIVSGCVPMTKDYYPNGQIKSKGRYSNGNKYGVWYSWHANGKISSQGKYRILQHHQIQRTVDHLDVSNKQPTYYSAKCGVWKFWHDNGNIQSEGNFVNGNKYGKWYTWHSNGKMKSKGDYIVVSQYYQERMVLGLYSSTKCNSWTYWDKQGNKIKEEVYQYDGKHIKTIDYKDGKPTEKTSN